MKTAQEIAKMIDHYDSINQKIAELQEENGKLYEAIIQFQRILNNETVEKERSDEVWFVETRKSKYGLPEEWMRLAVGDVIGGKNNGAFKNRQDAIEWKKEADETEERRFTLGGFVNEYRVVSSKDLEKSGNWYVEEQELGSTQWTVRDQIFSFKRDAEEWVEHAEAIQNRDCAYYYRYKVIGGKELEKAAQEVRKKSKRIAKDWAVQYKKDSETSSEWKMCFDCGGKNPIIYPTRNEARKKIKDFKGVDYRFGPAAEFGFYKYRIVSRPKGEQYANWTIEH